MAFEDRFVNAGAFAPAAADALPKLERDGLAIISEPFLTPAGVDFVRNALLRMILPASPSDLGNFWHIAHKSRRALPLTAPTQV